jgi:hypothetical protein
MPLHSVVGKDSPGNYVNVIHRGPKRQHKHHLLTVRWL